MWCNNVKKEEISRFEAFLNGFTKKNGKKLGEKTIHNILVLSKFIEYTKENETIENLISKHKKFLENRNYPMGKYSLWLYLKFLNYDEKIIKEVASFRKKNLTALTDEEKLAASVLSKKELTFLVDCISNLRDKVLLRILYDTGARISEILNLTLKDIDFDIKEVSVMGKGRKPRTIFIQNSTIELLKLLIKSKNIVSPNNLIFPIKANTAWYHLKKYGRKFLNRDLHPHMLRHTRLQHMADEGVDAFEIKAYAGHSSVSITETYVKSSKYQRKLAFEKAGDIWKKEK